MPIYEYECKKCGKIFEAFVLSKEEKITCPFCKENEVERLISSTYVFGSSSENYSCGSKSGGFS